MGSKTKISWCDATWNPIRGCSMAKGSETGGCLNCYAARLNARGLPGLKSPTTGEHFARILQSGPRWTGKVELIESQLMRPLKWRKPRKIFVNSMSDLFHEGLADEQIDQVFAIMARCPQHTFQCLSKRPERMKVYLENAAPRIQAYSTWPLPNVWMGVSVENQETADARIPLLLQTPAAVRFISLEPQLAPVDLRRYLNPEPMTRLNWAIQGGESGPGARPFNIAWARQAIAQCREAGVSCFVKQLGSNPRTNGIPGWDDAMQVVRLKDRKGGNMQEWPEDLRVREFPNES